MKKLTLRIELCHSTPCVWREFAVPSELSLEDLHDIIQDVMGWEDCHGHMFRKGKTVYMNEEDIKDMGFFGSNYIDELEVFLEDIFTRKNCKINYEYDFGDSWLHEITLIKQEPCNELFAPYCISGAEDCPPEDCGGIIGYQYQQEILKNPKHMEHKELKENYSLMPHFDLNSINEYLKGYFMDDDPETEDLSYEDIIKGSAGAFSSLLTKEPHAMVDLLVGIIKTLSPESQEQIRKALNDAAKAETKLIPFNFNDSNKHN